MFILLCALRICENILHLTQSEIKMTGRDNCFVVFSSPIRSLPRPLFSTFFITVVRNDRCWNSFHDTLNKHQAAKVSIHPLLHLKNRFLLLVQFSHNTAPTYPSCYAFNRSFNDWKLLSFRIFCISIVFCSSASGKENICY